MPIAAVVAIAAAGCAADSVASAEADVVGVGKGCVLERRTYTTAGAPLPALQFEVPVEADGVRLVVAAVSVHGEAELGVWIPHDGDIQVADHGDVTVAQHVPADRHPRNVEVHTLDGHPTEMRVTIDVVRDTPKCRELAFCYRAVGPGCSGVPIAAPVERLADGRRWMSVNPGSQLHDSCCQDNPHGHLCDGKPGGACLAEFNRAAYDVSHGATWRAVFDPTQIDYGAPAAAETSYQYQGALGDPIASGVPTSWGLSAPAHTWVETRDAEAWCLHGITNVTSGEYTRCQ